MEVQASMTVSPEVGARRCGGAVALCAPADRRVLKPAQTM
jgi:hypothetical protein